MEKIFWIFNIIMPFLASFGIMVYIKGNENGILIFIISTFIFYFIKIMIINKNKALLKKKPPYIRFFEKISLILLMISVIILTITLIFQ